MSRKPETHYTVKNLFYDALWGQFRGNQRALAEVAGISEEHLSAILTGRRPLTGRIGEKLAGALEMDFDCLFEEIE